jgi:hypothetical protein
MATGGPLPPTIPKPMTIPEIVTGVNNLAVQLTRVVKGAKPVRRYEDEQEIYTLNEQVKYLTRQLEERREAGAPIEELERDLATARRQRETNIGTLRLAADVTNPFATVSEIEAAIRRRVAAPAARVPAPATTGRPDVEPGVAAAAARRVVELAARTPAPADAAAGAAAAPAPAPTNMRVRRPDASISSAMAAAAAPAPANLPVLRPDASISSAMAAAPAPAPADLPVRRPDASISSAMAAAAAAPGGGGAAAGIGGLPEAARLAGDLGKAVSRGRTGVNPGTTREASARRTGNSNLGGGARRRRTAHRARRQKKQTRRVHFSRA